MAHGPTLEGLIANALAALRRKLDHKIGFVANPWPGTPPPEDLLSVLDHLERRTAVPVLDGLQGAAGRNPHTLVADPGTCRWTAAVRDPLGLGIAAFENTAPVYLIHPEHGGSGVAPGSWLVRRQQEGDTARTRRLIAD
ncbi:hypothetical protein [Amycolatopsis sp. NPDC051903]|uniref:hypothetical protein n=1 Tax=Amycolatopsis sp. NPDC051903 TaxID=3363936 RepID=UPI0037B6246D